MLVIAAVKSTNVSVEIPRARGPFLGHQVSFALGELDPRVRPRANRNLPATPP
jgi:hypothetical protein